MAEVVCGTTVTPTLSYMYEGEEADLRKVEVAVTEREWPVEDAEARQKALEEEIGPLTDDYGEQNVMWYINAGRNAAALLVFRHRSSPNRVRRVHDRG